LREGVSKSASNPGLARALYHVGIDDTDDLRGGCTTYSAYNVIKELFANGLDVVDLPRLLRLDPNVPWKTRGNAAVGFSVLGDGEQILETVKTTLAESTRGRYSSPGLVIANRCQRAKIRGVFSRAESRLLDPFESFEILSRSGAVVWGKKRRGLIGAAAAACNLLLAGDYSYELIAYRRPELIGTPRRVSGLSVASMDVEFHSSTFNNLSGFMQCVAPHGSDPVLFGLRGEDPRSLIRAMPLIRSETPSGWMIFVTNQGTDNHYQSLPLKSSHLGDSLSLYGSVTDFPRMVKGGHVMIELDSDGTKITAVAFRETGVMRDAVAGLSIGDKVMVMGGVKMQLPPSLNIEKLKVLRTVPRVILRNPLCGLCGRRTKSAGRGQGVRCEACGMAYKNSQGMMVFVPQGLPPGLYLPPSSSIGHLTKPLARYGREKRGREFRLRRFSLFN
jgi:tRNA(Ile2)-agmatinylcytidine synthase